MKNFIVLAGILALMSGAALSAQVTIGYDKSPEPFSVLELISNSRGMRLPQMSNVDKATAFGSDNLVLTTAGINAMGLTIFNTDNLCVETWNGNTWIAACMDCGGITFPTLSSTYLLCNDDKISDLTAAAGGNVSWYDNPTAGTKYADNTPLTNGETYYVEQGIGNCKPDSRTLVSVILDDCSSELNSNAYRIFAPVSVMYTYQYQDLTLYKADFSSGGANSFKWYVKKKGVAGNGTVITDATSATYRVPSNYCNSNDTLVFTCEYTNTVSTSQTVSTEIEFIHLNPANKINFNGVDYYWVELDVAPSYTGSSNSTGKLKILATNLGTETANAADLGDFYQWGRVADGHQTIGWSYTGTILRAVNIDAATVANQIDKAEGTIAYDVNLPSLASDNPPIPFMQITDNDHKGKFVLAVSDYVWQVNSSVNDLYIWAAQTTYAKTANDPCPSGWHVPSSYEWGALATGNPSVAGVSGTTNSTTYNTWRYPSSGFGSASHVGGTIVTQGTNQNGTTRIFLPAANSRGYTDGALNYNGNGCYWSSTCSNTSSSYFLDIDSTYVDAGAHDSSKADGLSVRCVAE
jgi:uncharacterized protein (TIGR02145 family)